MIKPLMAGFGILVLSGCATVTQDDAQTSPASSAQYEGAAWDAMQEGLLQYFSEDAASKLVYMAYHNVATTLCEGVEVDMAKYRDALLELHPENWSELTEQDRISWNNAFLGNYGMAYGVLLAEHADHRDALCAEVDRLIAEPDAGGSYFQARTTGDS